MLSSRKTENENKSIMVTNEKSRKWLLKVQWPGPILDIYFCPKSKNGMTFWTEKIAIFEGLP